MAEIIEEKNLKLDVLIKNKNNKDVVKRLLSLALNVNITDFDYIGDFKLNKISEYEFSLLKLVGNFENKKIEIYIRNIKGGEIKKSVFCTWTFLEENYYKQKDIEKENILIDEKKDKLYNNILCFKSENNESYNIEINLINLKQFVNTLELKFQQAINKCINFDDNDILLIMTKK